VHLDVDGAPVTVDEVNKLLGTNQNLKVKFQSEALNSWWARLSDAMQSVFRMNISISGTPTSEELHSLTRLAEIEVSDPISVSDLTAFGQFYRLESLVLTRTGLSDLGLLPNTESLKSLSITESPLSDLSSVLRFKALTSLNISNTAVDDLRPLSVLTNLEELNCSGTNLRRLRGLEELKKLQKLDCSNTSINKLDRLYGLSELLEVICFNSRLKSNDIAGLKEAQPQVKIIYY